jgi:membrane associated rhomboid family serine protease
MFKLYILYSHLLATCTTLGVILAIHLQLLGRLASPGSQHPCVGRHVERLMMASTGLLILTGGALVWLGLRERTGYLLNPTLIAKLLLVALMTANVLLLRRRVLPHLAQPASLLAWRPSQRLAVALPVALASSLWLTCAWLGFALALGQSMSVTAALGLAGLLFAGLLGALVWRLEARCQPRLVASTGRSSRLREYDEHEYLAM